MVVVIDIHAYLCQLRHNTKSVIHLKEETRTDIVDKSIRIFKILRVLIEIPHNMSTIVVICYPIFACITIIQTDSSAVCIAGKISNTILICKIRHREHMTFYDVASFHVAFAFRIEVTVIPPHIAHGFI